MERLSEEDMRSVAVAAGVVVLSIAAIIAFFFSGGDLIPFYVIAVLAILLCIYMTHRISKESKQIQRKSQRKAKA
jgi:4-hydroxybenzoate polyprenyltransferase